MVQTHQSAVAVCAVVFILVVAVWRYISLGSIVASAVYPFVVWWLNRPSWPLLASIAVCSGIVVARHSSNIQRLMAGTESSFHWGGKQP